MNTAPHNRPTGVVMPLNQMGANAKAAPRSVLGFFELKTVAVCYADDDGNIHTTVAHYGDGTWYLAPNGESYAGTLRPLNKDTWLVAKLDEKLLMKDGAASNVPKQDAVDVVGG